MATKLGKAVRSRVTSTLDKRIAGMLSKYGVGYPSFSRAEQPRGREPQPPYQRRVSPTFIYRLRQNSTLVNNAIEEKVSQTFRRGFTEIEKKWEAKCPACKETYETLQPFYDEFSWLEEGDEVDFSKERRCPDCDERVGFKTPDKQDKFLLESFLGQANQRSQVNSDLEPSEQNSVGQTLLEVFKEVGWDIQSFDDGWLIFERSYKTDSDGKIVDYELKGVHRAPPELMRYSVDENGHFGQEYYVCVECRATEGEMYEPQRSGEHCQNCGSHTYPVYAVGIDGLGRGNNEDPDNYFIRGEFVHASEYEPSKFYGYSPILTLWDEASTLEKMDNWYREAYKERRAPRGAMIISSSNSESTRAFNKGEMEKLRNDPNYIPTFIDDSQSGEGGKPIEFINLLETPAAMQHMEMREWFLDRISAKYGVTAVFQSGSPENAGLSQSMEIQVSNRSADRLRTIFNNTFFPAILGQLGVDGWEVKVDTVEEEDEQEEAQLTQTHLKMAKLALEIGAQVEWTANDRADIKAGKLEAPQEEEGQPGMGGLGEMMGGGADEMMGEDGDPEAGSIPAQDEEQDPGPQGGAEGGMAPKPEEGDGDPRFQSPGKSFKMTRDEDDNVFKLVKKDD
ncbi:portal protein [Halovirus HCTV-5]|uniref:portal protein n=1 Tax=Halovirus HCTV-5 TaxID=1273748 RepID=UPI0003348AFD|nr:portal protein [Halovirus HCTV-5]AGM11715.1 portal protein [Halovirus HCTV-5]